MKKILLIAVLLLQTIGYGQNNDLGNNIVTGVKPITRTNAIPATIAASQPQAITAKDYYTFPTGNSKEVGITDGTLSVSLTGAATYNIPIAVPAGINGVTPQVSLAYNSQAGHGLAGFGWNIAGVSAITRIPSTQFHDGVSDPVDFDALDRFALDGQRLIVKDGGVYGADGTVYETEHYSNVKVTAIGVSPDGASYGPASFLVEYPDGSKAYYGNSTNSRCIMSWGITYWENPQGVRVSYDYITKSNNLIIDSIKYGATGTNTPINEIKFEYQSRNRGEWSYIVGKVSGLGSILTKIKVKCNGVGFRNYNLQINSANLYYDQLYGITESNGDNTKSYNPTVFSYDNSQDYLYYKPITTDLAMTGITLANAVSVPGDYNGDGKMDFILYPNTPADPNSKKKYWLFDNLQPNPINANPNIGLEVNSGPFEDIFPVTWITQNNKLLSQQGWCMVKKNSTTSVTTFETYADKTDPDGIAGFSQIVGQGSKDYTFPKFDINTFSNSYTTGDEIPLRYVSGDFNHDGLTDVLTIEQNLIYDISTPPNDGEEQCKGCGVNEYRYIGSAYFVNLDQRATSDYVVATPRINVAYNSILQVADVNGDGQSDLLVFDDGNVRVYSLNLATNQLELLFSMADIHISIYRTILLGDYNGDGKADFMIPKGYGKDYASYYGTGIGFKKYNEDHGIPYKQNTSTNTYHIIANDLNNDGKTDLALVDTYRWSGQGYIEVALYSFSNRGLFTLRGSASSGMQSEIRNYPIPIFLNTFQPNNSLELAFVSGSKIHYFNTSRDYSVEKLLYKIRTGQGVEQNINYKPLQYDRSVFNSVYSNTYLEGETNNESYPNINIIRTPSLWVVSQLAIQSNTDYKKQLYAYYGAVTNLEGLGFKGFKGTLKTNWFNATTPMITTYSKYDLSKRGAMVQTYTTKDAYQWDFKNMPTSLISKSTASYDYELSSSKVFKLKNTGSTTTNELDNTSVETTISDFDSYNNPKTSTSITKSATTIEQTATTTVDYDNLTTAGTSYIIGRPKSKTTSVTHNGSTKTTEAVYAYNSNNLLSEVKTKANGSNYITQQNDYDSYGNVIQKRITATGVSPRVTSYSYDSSNRFVRSSTDIEKQTNKYDYDSYGRLTTLTDPFGFTTQYGYDTWGKQITATDYLGNVSATTYAYIPFKFSTQTLVTNTGADGSYSTALLDDLGRTIKSTVKNVDNTLSSVDTQYDIYNRVVSSSEPYNEATAAASQFTTNTYDEYGRLSSSLDYTKKTTNITYNGLTTTVSDGIKNKTTLKNALGYMMSSTDNGGTINYLYDGSGNMKSSTFENTTITMDYDSWGRKTKLTDPSAGTYTYKYNDLGELLEETTPKGKTTYALDLETGNLLGKTIKGDLTDSKTTYNYDPTSKLLLTSKFEDFTEKNTTSNEFTYDNYKRIITNKEITPYAIFTKRVEYNTLGQLASETSIAESAGKSSSKTIKNSYKNGSHYQVLDDSTTPKVLWQTNTVNARGQLTGATLGNGISIANSYDEFGFAKEIKHNTGGTTPVNVMTLGYSFDEKRGNLNNRSNSMLNWNEAFAYDNLDRLIEFTNAKGVKELQDYDNKGRILKNNVGDYKYTNTAKEYQNTSVDLSTEAMSYYTNREGIFNDSMENEKEWGAVNHPGAVFYSYDTTKSYSGTTSLKFTNTTTTVQYAHSNKWIPIVNPVATQYTISARVYSENAVQVAMLMFMGKGNEGMNSDPNLPYDVATITTLPKSWQLITKVVIVPAGTVKLNLRLDNYNTGEVWFDDIKIIKTADALPTGIFNEDMEKRSGWNSLALMGTNVTERSINYDKQQPPHSGQYSLRLNNDNTTEKVVHNENWIAINNTRDTNYTYSAWVYSNNLDAKISLLMKTADERGYYTQIDNVINISVRNAGKWVLVQKKVLVPASIKKLNIRLDIPTGGGTIYYDDVKIQKTGDNNTLKVLNTSYNAFKSPVEIEETGIDKLSFTYNDNNDRSAMFYGSLDYDKLKRLLRKYYSGDGTMEVKYNTLTNAVEFLTYIGGDGYSAPIALKSDGTTQNYLYLHRDYQGSILAITDDNATVLEKRLFDAWGNIVKVQDGNGLPIAQGSWLIDRGYTGHEHLQSIGIIHMNGRLYDPKLHRFMQPDNFVQDPTNTQNYNRYGYVMNNPLVNTDPSGEECVECTHSPWYFTAGTSPQIPGGNRDDGVKEWWYKNVNSFNNFLDRNFRSIEDDYKPLTDLWNSIFGSSSSSEPKPLEPFRQDSSSSWTGGGSSFSNGGGISTSSYGYQYLDGLNDQIEDSINPVNWAKGLWNSFIESPVQSRININNGTATTFDYFNSMGAYISPVAQLVDGVYSSASRALSGDGYAAGRLTGQVVTYVVVKEIGSYSVNAVRGEMSELSSLKPTHYITKSERVMKGFVNEVKLDGAINESIKYVEHNGSKFIVDGNHRFFASQKLGIKNVPIQQVQLPFRGYQTTSDLFLSGRQAGWWKYFKP
jgi:RHS repeat-associated protein